MTSRANRIFSLAAGALLLACSSSGGGNATPFVGTWTYDSTSSVTPMNCTIPIVNTPLDPTPVSLAGQQITLSVGADSSHLVYSQGTSCTVTFAVSGTTATAVSGQTCSFTFSTFNVAVSITSWTLTLSGDKVAGSFSGSAALGGPSCTATGSGTLDRNTTDGSTAG